jgi:predicted Zn-dependent protease
MAMSAGALLPTPALAQNNLPALGDTASEDFNTGTERRLGDAIMREIRRDRDYLDDPVLLEYLQSLWQPLLTAAQALGDVDDDLKDRFAYEPFLVRDRSVNAFALPGGFVGVHLGLMAITQTRDELASVLAHEMTHVNQRHIAQGFANSKKQSILTAAAMIIGILAASRSGGGDAANAMIMGGQAAGIQGQLNFSRQMEREADRIGMSMMSTAGFEPSGMAAMFERLQNASRLNDYGGYPYLRSHPLTTERIGEARARLGVSGVGSPRATLSQPASALEHTASLARARVLMDTRPEALGRWQALAADGSAPGATRSERFADAYSAALASSLQRDWKLADAALRTAMSLARGSGAPQSHYALTAPPSTPVEADVRAERAVLLLQTQSLIDRGQPVQAREALAPLVQSGSPVLPNVANTSRPVLLMSARITLASPGDARAVRLSTDQLQTWVAQYPLDPLAWMALSRLLKLQGQSLSSLRAEAESSYALGDLPGAIDRLRAGRRLAGPNPSQNDFVELSVIDSRLRTIEAQRRQQLKDAQG